jgi:hypothetical protein
MNNSAIMLDIESLSLQPNAQILSIAAIKFDPFEITVDFSNNPKLDILLDLEEQVNRHQDENTILWWSKQDKKVQAKIFNEEDRLSINETLNQLTKFCWQMSTIWCQGPTFDITVLNNLYAEYGRGIPWKYNAIRDSRTVLSLVDIENPIVTHDSIEDVIRQAKLVQLAIQKLGIIKFYC